MESDRSNALPPALASVLAEVDGPDVVGIALTGSYARGDATPESDVDVLIFAREMPAASEDRYRLVVRDDVLYSLSTTTVEAKREELSQPEAAIFAVPGLRQMRVLRDPSGVVGSLQAEAVAFSWEALRPAAERYASEMVMGNAEEASKVLGALRHPGPDQASALTYAALGLLFGLTRAVAVARGLLISSENAYFHLVQEAVGEDTPWTRAHRLLCGMDAPPAGTDPIQAQGRAALTLYIETATMLDALILSEHRAVVARTVHRIQKYTGMSSG